MAQNEEKYNGWTNYETWVTGLWLENEETSYQYWREQAAAYHQSASTCDQATRGIWTPKEAAVFNLAEQVKAVIEESSPLSAPDLYTDLLNAAIQEVNWREIAESLLEGMEEPPDHE